MSFGFTVGAALGPFLTGYIFDTRASYDIAFLLCGIIGVIGAALSVLLSPIKGKLSKIVEGN
jgi:MFS family permease